MPSDEYEAGEEIEAAEGSRRRRSKLPYEREGETDFAEIVIEHLRTAGVQQAHKEDRITFTSLAPWPGEYVGAEGRFMEGEREKRAAILIGPEFGTIARPDLIAAAREAAEAGFDVLIACGFAYDAHASEFSRLGPLPVLRARMNPDLHMADELKNTGAGNMFVVFGEPDVEVRRVDGDQIEVEIKGVDVFDPQTGEVRSGGTDDIAAWFIDTDYDEESFFVRHAYFLGAHDPYKALKTTLKAEIDEDAWASLYRATSRPFPKPSTGRFAVKVINHVGDEVMKVSRCDEMAVCRGNLYNARRIGDDDGCSRTRSQTRPCVRDGELVRVGFMSPQDVEAYVKQLREVGLTYLDDGTAKDVVVVDQMHGPAVPCEWIECGQVNLDGDPSMRVTACRLKGSAQSILVRPERWTFAGLVVGVVRLRSEPTHREEPDLPSARERAGRLSK